MCDQLWPKLLQFGCSPALPERIFSRCLDDVVQAQEERRRNGNRSKWAKESDKEFLMRMLATNREEDSSSSPSPSPLIRTEHTDFHESYACCRQRYLRSYIFTSKKPTAAQRTKNWIKEKKKKNLKAGDKNLKGRTCSFMDSCLKVLLFCVAKVDVNEY
ncbi:hypothetical protein RHMOL_Rhmol08G0130600 [Rhododendron molle]|uniref:Uncharacterized protein n=1 Tax=Rhododendron molle TaxID=49168 RepID=A0ACC0MN18_RHOML|nr:hypothetical protein RHMOL_Rhmol08G0130600 [Rhododendron molle]